ncbi:MAG: hypothetical protein GPJ13_02935 [Microcystis aeruginosa W11-06]|nr:hypothetical protein [Microcystis aeruginosa W11-03]NCR92761.1 hypothetical protein [Microcystis aeruginosa W11-06]
MTSTPRIVLGKTPHPTPHTPRKTFWANPNYCPLNSYHCFLRAANH